jgi:hypothetical protein
MSKRHEMQQRRVEHILRAAGRVGGSCHCYRGPDLVSVHADWDDSVVIRPTRLPPNPWATTLGATAEVPQLVDEFRVRQCIEPLSKAGLFATEERDARGPLVRVREL